MRQDSNDEVLLTLIKAKIEQVHHRMRTQQIEEQQLEKAEANENQHSLKCIQTITKALKSFNKNETGDVIVGEASISAESLIDYIKVVDFAVEIHLQQGLTEEAKKLRPQLPVLSEHEKLIEAS